MESSIINCKRCGKPFEPEPTNLKSIPYTRHCIVCRVRNLLDGLDISTPPELLDRYTRNPILIRKK